MGISRVRPSRFIGTKTLSATERGNLPAGAPNSYTVAITGLPTRGLIHRVTVNMRKGSAWAGGDADQGCWLLHTNGTDAANSVTDGEAATVIGQAAYNPKIAAFVGGDIALSTNVYPWCEELNFSSTMLNGATSPVREVTTSVGKGEPVYYDVSGDVLGPETNDGTLYLSLVSDGNANYASIVTSCVIRFEVEPCF